MIPSERTNRPTEVNDVTALSFTSDTRRLARLLEDREVARVGKLPVARGIVARRAGCAPGTLENLRKGRLKRIEGWLHAKLEGLLVREIEAEIKRLTNELEAYRRAGGDAAQAPQMARLVAAVEEAQRVIRASLGEDGA